MITATEDAIGLAAIHAASFPPAQRWDAAALQSLLASAGCFAFWCPARAFILLRTVLDEAEILTLATAPAHRREGLAARLLDAAAAACVARGVLAGHLEVAPENLAASSLYEKAGFRQVGRRPGYYADGADALLLRLNLSAG